MFPVAICDLFFPGHWQERAMKNNAEAIGKLCSRMKGKTDYMCVMEATGGYESLCCALLLGKVR